MAKKAPSKSATLVVISIIYILMGIGSVLTSFELILQMFKGSFPGAWTLLTVIAGVMMFLAGIFGLFKVQRGARAWMGILIFIVALVGLVFSIVSCSGFERIGTSLMQAAVAWLYITYNQ